MTTQPYTRRVLADGTAARTIEQAGRKGGIRHQGGLYLAVPKLSTIETSGVIDDSELLCHEQLVALDNFLDHFAFRIEPEIG